MKVIQGLDSQDLPLSNTVVAIGVFDGVHRGHQEIFHQTAREARSLQATPTILTFDIHPSQLLAPHSAPGLISTLDQRVGLIRKYGEIEAVLIAPFTREFASLSPLRFVEDILIGALGARHILVGADFHYGRNRAGTISTLLSEGAERGFAVTIVPPVLYQGARISSTLVREALAVGDVVAAADLMGHPFVYSGVVVEGKKLGRTIGYPTANLAPVEAEQIAPANGIYAGIAYLEGGRQARAAVSVGSNPTTDSDGRRKIEAYLMNGFQDDLYGQRVDLEFRQKLRDEQKFASLDDLTAQIARDVEDAEALLSQA
ncbi:riboflavin biosynthesis protein [Capsulimonas corticalis]|uniref:Riboflavin biosynthesis protein n=1 Tax=Capsulimonas corticalis TaxID=2219043 RepID=A0A402CXK0_9BACT|nr:bifunctional riboflavin kinase/FAD synthetase [Capsulimonas corticalis]BDI32260.1 riboflavin biosynthesis protein [Capsulimonas corticalis]